MVILSCQFVNVVQFMGFSGWCFAEGCVSFPSTQLYFGELNHKNHLHKCIAKQALLKMAWGKIAVCLIHCYFSFCIVTDHSALCSFLLLIVSDLTTYFGA